jgi:hypothetical protein
MTVCAAIIPTKVHAATLSIGSGRGQLIRSQIQARPGDIIDFTFYLQAEPGNRFVTVLEWEQVEGGGTNPFFDTSELEQVTPVEWQVSRNIPLDLRVSRAIATWKLRARTPVKDTIPDISASLRYSEETRFGLITTTAPASGPDVVPVPEPLTMLGAAAALGYGVILKRKSSKNTEF